MKEEGGGVKDEKKHEFAANVEPAEKNRQNQLK